MDHFLNAVKGYASQLDQSYAHSRIGIVSSVDVDSATVRVIMQPEGVLSGWLPVASSWVGNGWGFVCPPQAGDQVIVIPQEGDAEQGLVIGRLWSSVAPPPPTPSGECWLIHSSGSYVKLRNDGSIESAAATWTHYGNFQATGDVSDSHGSLSELRQAYNEHVHPPSQTPPVPID